MKGWAFTFGLIAAAATWFVAGYLVAGIWCR